MSLITTPIAPPQARATPDSSFALAWNSNLADVAALGLVFDESFASGCTEAQALAALSVTGGVLKLKTSDAVAAGADADFSARFWMTGNSVLEPGGLDIGFRAQLVDGGNSTGTPYAYINILLYHCDLDGTLSNSPLGGHSQNSAGFKIRNYTNPTVLLAAQWFDGTYISPTTLSAYLRGQFVNLLADEGTPRGGLTIYSDTADYVTTTGGPVTKDDPRNIGEIYDPTVSAFRVAIEVSRAPGSSHQMELDIPRFSLFGRKAA